jgi:DNA-binding MurR/RpiR family transcriptional regulator
VRINGLYPALRESEKKVADYIRRNFEQVIHLSISETAEAAGASESTVVRLCKALEYRGFQDFKIHLAGECRAASSQIHESIGPKDSLVEIKQKVFESDIAAVRDTLQVLDDKAFAKAVAILGDAESIEIYGTGGSGTVAMDAQHKFLKIGKKCFAYSDTDLQAMSASLLGPGDAAIGITHSGGNKEVLEALKIARKAGAAIISITNYGRSPVTQISDAVLFTASRETAFKSDAMSSRIAELVIFDALWAALAFRDYDTAFENIRKTRGATASKKY